MYDLFGPPPRFWYISFFLEKFFIAFLASVSHDQDFEPNLYFSHSKVHQYLEKFPKTSYLISGGNFLSPRQTWPPLYNGKIFYVFILCFRVSWSFLVLATKKKQNKYGTFWVLDPPLCCPLRVFTFVGQTNKRNVVRKSDGNEKIWTKKKNGNGILEKTTFSKKYRKRTGSYFHFRSKTYSKFISTPAKRGETGSSAPVRHIDSL